MFISTPIRVLFLSIGLLLTFCENTYAWSFRPVPSDENNVQEGSEINNVGEYQANPNCVCVPEYLCDPDTQNIITDGSGVVGWRSSGVCGDEAKCCFPPEGEGRDPKHLEDESGGDEDEGTDTSEPEATSSVTENDEDTGNGLEGTEETSPFVCGARSSGFLSLKVSGDLEDTYAMEWDFPWMLAIKYQMPVNDDLVQVLVCGASLVLPSVAITAAHCIDRKQIEDLIIVGGEYDLANNTELIPPQERKVRQVFLHPKFDRSPIVNDVAIMVLDRPFVKSNAVTTICIPEKEKDLHWAGCYALGWGLNGDGDSDGILKKAKMPLVPHEICAEQLKKAGLGRNFRLSKSFLCAGGDDVIDTCKGDGGGPLACQQKTPPYSFYLVGITSWGVGCGHKEVPGVYADVADAADWIGNTVQQLTDSNAIPSQ